MLPAVYYRVAFEKGLHVYGYGVGWLEYKVTLT